MRLTVLGKYGPYPKENGGCSSYLVEDGDTKLLLDMGCGAYSRLHRHIDPLSLDAVIITHYHYDHCSDLGILQYAHQIANSGGLSVFSPPPDGLYKVDSPFKQEDVSEGARVKIGGVTAEFHRVLHPVASVCVRLTGASGRSLFYTGDTRWMDELVEYAEGADVLLADTGLLFPIPNLPAQPHLTAAEVGKLVKQARVGRLICTHISPLADERELLDEVNFDGAVVAEEGMSYEV
ncbi:MAG: MBL fold metallo-hydrolase [Clostridia bacterium]|nr:MBL fold metallo-hydrolase [Clostridia bacterium]